MKSSVVLYLINFYRDNGGNALSSAELKEFEAKVNKAVVIQAERIQDFLAGAPLETILLNQERLELEWVNQLPTIELTKKYKVLVNFYAMKKLNFGKLIKEAINNNFSEGDKERVLRFLKNFFVFNLKGLDVENLNLEQANTVIMQNLLTLLFCAGFDLFETFLLTINGFVEEDRELNIISVGTRIAEKEGNTKFNNDVKVGEASELRFMTRINEILSPYILRIEQSVGYAKEFDCRITFKVKNMAIPLTFESKTHPAVVFTKNYYLETKCSGMSSGVNTVSDILINESFEIVDKEHRIASYLAFFQSMAIPFCFQISETKSNSGDGGRVTGFTVNAKDCINFYNTTYFSFKHIEGIKKVLIESPTLAKDKYDGVRQDFIARLSACRE